MAAVINALPSKEQMEKWVTMDIACEGIKVSPQLWQEISAKIGEENFQEIEILVQISPQEFQNVIEEVVGTNIIKRTRLAMLYNALQVKFDGKIFPFFTPKENATQDTCTVLATTGGHGNQRESV